MTLSEENVCALTFLMSIFSIFLKKFFSYREKFLLLIWYTIDEERESN